MSPNVRSPALAALALAALVVTAGCAGVVDGANDAPASLTTDGVDGGAPASAVENSVSVAAVGSVTADPDRAVIHVAASATADTADAARRRVAENVSTLRRALADAGVPDDAVTTDHYNIRQTRESREAQKSPETPDRTEYRATHTLSVEVDDVSRVGEIIRVAVENGASDVQHVEFTLSEDKRAELRDRALSEAMSNARDDAAVLASNANLTIDGVHAVSTGGTNVRPYHTELAAATANAGGAATNVESGPVTVTANVQVTYDASE